MAKEPAIKAEVKQRKGVGSVSGLLASWVSELGVGVELVILGLGRIYSYLM